MEKIFIPLIALLFSCSTKKNSQCDCYTKHIQKDTIILTTEHIHIGTMCSSDTTMILCVVDTIYIPKQR
jgi:hypothetical protein